MNIMELNKSIQTKQFQNLYIFYGEEYTILEIYIKKLVDALGAKYKSSETVQTIYRTLNNKSLFSNGKEVYVVRDDKEFTTAETMWKDIIQKLKNKNITLIVKYSNIDMRSKFAKAFEEQITQFDKLADSVIHKYIKKDLDIPDNYVEYLASICKNDYGRILLEINKVKNAAKFYNLSDKDAFTMCANANVFYVEPEGEVFDLVDAIMTRNVKSVEELLNESKRRDDNSILILTMLHNNVKAVLQVQLMGQSKNMSEATGLTGFQLKNAYKYVNRYTCEELVRFMKYLHYCDKSIKDGTISSDIAVDYLLVNVL